MDDDAVDDDDDDDDCGTLFVRTRVNRMKQLENTHQEDDDDGSSLSSQLWSADDDVKPMAMALRRAVAQLGALGLLPTTSPTTTIGHSAFLKMLDMASLHASARACFLDDAPTQKDAAAVGFAHLTAVFTAHRFAPSGSSVVGQKLRDQPPPTWQLSRAAFESARAHWVTCATVIACHPGTEQTTQTPDKRMLWALYGVPRLRSDNDALQHAVFNLDAAILATTADASPQRLPAATATLDRIHRELLAIDDMLMSV